MRLLSKAIFSETVVGDALGTPESLEMVTQATVHGVWDVNTPAADTFTSSDINNADDEITLTAHDMTTGLKGRLTTSGVLPTGVSAGVDYFVIVVDANTIQLAASLSDALAGTAITISNDGSGTHTFTPTALAGGSLKLQVTNDVDPDNATWVDVANAQSPSADGSYLWSLTVPVRFVRVSSTLTAGRMAVTVRLQALSH